MPPKKAAPKKAPATKKKAEADAEDAPKTKGKRTEAPGGKPGLAPGAAVAPAKVDSHYPGSGSVYQEGGVNWDAMLNQTNIGANNNKFYVIQLIDNGGGKYTSFTRWGRVGESGQQASVGGNLEAAKKAFSGKFKDKTKNDWAKVSADPSSFKPADGKYTLVETAADDTPAVAAPQQTSSKPVQYKPSALPKQMQSMLGIIFDKDMFKQQMAEHKLDANKMPLGKLTKAQVEKGYNALDAIDKAVKGKTKLPELQKLSSAFYTIIPHDFGRSIPPTISTAEAVKEKVDLLNLLNDIQIAVSMDDAAQGGDVEEHPLDKQYSELNCEIEFVDPASPEWKLVDEYTKNGQGYRKCKLKHLFRVDRPQDAERMAKFKHLNNRKLLWHGTNIAVVAAILKSGLRIMPHAGGRVGRGLYFASENGKSAGYVRADKKTGFMFLAEVAMGNIKEISQDDHTLCETKVKGMKVDSILARGRQEPDPKADTEIDGPFGKITVPKGKPQSGAPALSKTTFSQSEYLVYNEGQAAIRYILQMDFDY